VLPAGVQRRVVDFTSSLVALVFPEECRVCGRPLHRISRVPVCGTCLNLPVPFDAEHFCIRCRTPFRNRFPLDEEGVCGLCRTGARGFDAAYTFGAYDGALRELIHLLKYGRIRTLARPLANHLVASLPLNERFDAIVPMPMHWTRLWQRGFNQARLLAEEIGRRRGIPVIRAVRRRRQTAPQAGLSHARRRANVAGAFAPVQEKQVRGKRLLLVDDVMTTGATASACGLALKSVGADYVAVLTLARADRRFDAPVRNSGVL